MKHKRHRQNWVVFDPIARRWWGPHKQGRFPDITNAGLYTMVEAIAIQKEARKDPHKWDRAINLEEYRVEIERLYQALGKKVI